jgi:hypothetical protein
MPGDEPDDRRSRVQNLHKPMPCVAGVLLPQLHCDWALTHAHSCTATELSIRRKWVYMVRRGQDADAGSYV